MDIKATAGPITVTESADFGPFLAKGVIRFGIMDINAWTSGDTAEEAKANFNEKYAEFGITFDFV